MVKNSVMRFIDSCVGNIARKIEDEFDESKHPRDKGGKFTSKGGEGRGGGKEEKLVRTHKAGNITPERADALNEAAVALEEAGVPKQKILKMSNEGDLEGMQKLLESKRSSERKNTPVKASETLKDTMDDDLRQISENADSKEEFLENAKSYLEDYLLGDLADGDYAEENFEMSSEDVEAYVKDYIESGKLDKLADDYYEEDDDTSVTGPDDQDYMNEEDEDDEASVSLNSLTGDKMYGPAVVNALQYQYDGDAKKVGAVVKQLNAITSEPDMWGEYTVQEIIEDLEGRFGELDDVTKRHIDTYLRKTNPAEWASEAEYWKKKFKNNPGPHPQSFYE